jgi:hypothetical protein
MYTALLMANAQVARHMMDCANPNSQSESLARFYGTKKYGTIYAHGTQ